MKFCKKLRRVHVWPLEQAIVYSILQGYIVTVYRIELLLLSSVFHNYELEFIIF